MLAELVGPGDVIVDLSWNVETLDMLRVVRRARRPVHQHVGRGVGSVRRHREQVALRTQPVFPADADPAAEGGARPRAASRVATAIIDHGANPGLVSHFTKRALLEIAAEMIEKGLPAATGVEDAAFETADRRRRGVHAPDRSPGSARRPAPR